MKTTKDPKTSTLKQFEIQIDSLRKEIEVMAHVGAHPYVLRLLGAITTKDLADFCVVTEYCEFGSLDEFLKQKSSRKLFIDEIVANTCESAAENSRSTQYIVSFFSQKKT